MFKQRLIAQLLSVSIALSPTTGVWAARDLATESLNLNLPSMGAVAGTELSPSEEQALGEEMMRQIRGDPAYLNDAETLEYLNRLGYKLVSVSDTHTYNFFFYPLIDHSLNAFAIPGGFIAVHTGLIVAAQNESELAGVIAHEIGHVSQRHIARMIDAQKGNAALTLGSFLLALLAARAGSGDAASALAIGGQAALIQNQLSYSRGAEREADRVGLNSLVKAGFDPKGMENFFMRLQKNNRYYEAAAPAYLLTHPLTVERISDMENRTRQLGSREHTDSLDFLLIQQRMRVLQETKYDGWLAVSKEMKQELAKEKDQRKKVALTYGLSVVSQKLNQKSDAIRYANQAVSLGGNNAILLKNQSETLFNCGSASDRARALQMAKRLVNNNPLSEMAVKLYAGELYALKRYKETLSFMRSQQAMTQSNASLHAINARCYRALNQMSRHHMAVGDMYLVQGDKRAAEYQYNLAQQANDGDYYTMSQVDGKLRSTRADIIAEEKAKDR
ncbi:MAG TPA: M48 family metallopeptidase [Candidatus Aphodousia faecigallinarum]|uniref:M48 family metallopeptidase n=1 Tax=Candidatus Aphodousia faecigallinarum TaxID=2840677 RepID=A0A9D1LEB7_9BURK|nr:M48 family metallopeptidase [Candidatus Aphodousia faecigallinarum]